MTAAGGCLCGAVRYRVAGKISSATACHCSQCRRASGHVLAFVGARRDEVTVEGAVGWFESTPGVIRRGFCPRCGSQLFWDRIGDAQLDIAARVEGRLRDVVACHCGQCRRGSGHHAAATAAPRAQVAIAGEVRWHASSPEARRGFCATCGSSLFWERPGSGAISIWAGRLDAPTGLRLAGHIYVSDRGDYYDIADGLPQAPAGAPELTRLPQR